jgi:fluoride exporter
MRKYTYIGCGSFIGAVLRYLIKGIQIYSYQQHFPVNTLFINISGAFLMAFIMTTAFEVWSFDPDIRLGITAGFLGAFTTFSALCKETVVLMQNGDYFSAAAYITLSTVLGLGAAYLGFVLARGLGSKTYLKKTALHTDEILSESDVD